MWDAEKKDWERLDGNEASRILEFDVAAQKFTGRFWYYRFEANSNAIGDFNMIDGTTGFSSSNATMAKARRTRPAPPASAAPTASPMSPSSSGVYKIELTDANAGQMVRKIGYIDLLKIQDPDKKARKPLTAGVLAFPFFYYRERRRGRCHPYRGRQRQ